MSFTLNIDTANAAMQDDSTGEPHVYSIAEALRDVAARVETFNLDGRIRDDNGNTVGSFGIRDDGSVLDSLMDVFDSKQRSLLLVCIQRYVDDLRTACEEDQGIPEGEPGTVGRMLQDELAELAVILRTGLKATTTVA